MISLFTSRRRRWILASAAGLVIALVLLLCSGRNLAVVVYDDTDRPFRGMAVCVGAQRCERAMLDAHESAVFSFRPVTASSDVSLFVDADLVLRWSAPSLANPSVARVILRVDESGAVTMTLEKPWTAQVSGWFE